MKKIVALLSTVIALPLCGETLAYTAPSGYVKTDLVVGFNPLGINLHGEILVSGIIDSEAANVITDADVDFAAALSDGNATYLFEVTSGSQNGSVSVITSSTATTVTIEGPGVSAGTESYTIRQARTLNEVFGTGANAMLAGGITPASADIVWLPDGSGGYFQYFYSTFGGANEFRPTTAAFAPVAKPVSIFYPDGLFVQVASTAKEIRVFGEVKTTPTIASAAPGFSLISLQNPVGQTLAESGLNAFITAGNTPSGADILFIPTGPSTYNEYFFSTFLGANVWRLKSSPFAGDEGGTTLPSSFFIQNTGVTTKVGVITLPAFFSTL
jgi:hypothetical protein